MSHSVQRLRLVIRGAVQGVGFRPFVYRLATELGLRSWVLNSVQGVFIELEGEPPTLQRFVKRLYVEKPPRASIQSMEQSVLEPVGYTGFEIRHSEHTGEKTTLILPDLATCPDCLREIFDPTNRRYRYPFTNCTNCGPRYSIIESLPYDRPNTTMKAFNMCARCREEYAPPPSTAGSTPSRTPAPSADRIWSSGTSKGVCWHSTTRLCAGRQRLSARDTLWR